MMRYRTIVADPPWPGDWWTHGRGPKRPQAPGAAYDLMSLEDILALPVPNVAHQDGNLFLWVTARLNREGVGVRVARGWGFEPCGEIVWDKPNPGGGRFPRACHEVLLVCSRGATTLTGPFNVRSVQQWKQPRRPDGSKIHSAKPDAALELIERHSPGPYLEMFARRQRLGWSTWGNEVSSDVVLESAS